MNPLVSCIMPTRNRGRFVESAVSNFLRQDYPNRELVILDDGDQPERYAFEDARVMSIKINPPNSIGAKRNMCCDFAKGELICHWDDDDWYARDRIRSQVEALQANPEAQATVYSSMIFARDSDRKAWRFSGDSANAVGVSLMYRRDWWKQHRFDESLPFGEDNAFVRVLGSRLAIASGESIVARIHPGNTCPRVEERRLADGSMQEGNLKNGQYWQPVEWDSVMSLGYEASK